MALVLLVAGMGFEPHDLQVMSLASYRTALPRAQIVSGIIPYLSLAVKPFGSFSF